MRKLLIIALIFAAACGAPVPPAPPQPRQPTAVAAPAGKTWNAVIDAFASDNIPIRNMDRSSGFISTDALAVGRDDAKRFADCGTIMGMAIPADLATYNVLVRGDSTSSTVKVTVRWTDHIRSPSNQSVECSTRAVWERDFEAKVKAAAEGGAP